MDERKDIVNQRQIKRRADKASAQLSFPENWLKLVSGIDDEPLAKRRKSEFVLFLRFIFIKKETLT
jgi:hypothetical protein